MAGINMEDIDQLRTFASRLTQFQQEVLEEVSTVRSACDHLGEVWGDHNFNEFSESLDEHVNTIRPFLEEGIDNFTKYLIVLADKADDVAGTTYQK